MKTVFLLLMLMSQPNQPSVKYNAILYNSSAECEMAKIKYMNMYRNKKQEYKKIFVTDAHCIPFDAFPLVKTGVGI